MVDTYRTGTAGMSGSSLGDPGARSQSPGVQGATRATYPTHDVGSRAAGLSDDYAERYESRRSRATMDDVVVALGTVLGGAVGYMLATTLSGDGSRSGQSSSQGRGMFGRASSDRFSGRDYGASSSSSVQTDETDELIASNKVEGTAVYNRQGEKLGSVYNFMVGKRSGRVAYAVMSFGGFLGIGQSYHALPWNVLTYDTDRGGYVVDADRDRLMGAPSYQDGQEPFSRPDDMRQVREYWSSGRLSL